jgi:myo-inositol 2-dehydrogenase / D-chiro-inositol 1-dehydrogenase
VTFEDGRSIRTLPPGRDPYERQAEAFLDAVEAGDPGAVLSSYGDAVRTDRLTRAVVAATGRSG